MTGPVEDPSDRPTRLYDFGGASAQVIEAESGATEPDPAPRPWYRNRVLLALWALMVALLLTLIVYGIVELSRGGGATGPSTTTSRTPTTTTSPSPASSTPTTSDTPPPPETPEQTPEEAPPPANASPAPAQPPHHHHHLPHIPSTITLPHTVVTLPHGF